jgi:hypothetical protein
MWSQTRLVTREHTASLNIIASTGPQTCAYGRALKSNAGTVQLVEVINRRTGIWDGTVLPEGHGGRPDTAIAHS